MLSLRPELSSDFSHVEDLLDLSFGADRHAKTSYRYRDGVDAIPELCFVAERGDRLVGAIRYWPMLLDNAPCLLLGPLAIEPEQKNTGIGRALVSHTLAIAAENGERHVFLVGDNAYYQRFGFVLAPAAVVMPGEQAERLNWLGLNGSPPPYRGGTLRSWRCLRSASFGRSEDATRQSWVMPAALAMNTGS